MATPRVLPNSGHHHVVDRKGAITGTGGIGVIYKCERCGKEFTTCKKLLIHLRWSDFYKKCSPRRVVPPSGPPYFCRYCARPFDTLPGLYRHQSWTIVLGHCYVPNVLYVPTWLPGWTSLPSEID